MIGGSTRSSEARRAVRGFSSVQKRRSGSSRGHRSGRRPPGRRLRLWNSLGSWIGTRLVSRAVGAGTGGGRGSPGGDGSVVLKCWMRTAAESSHDSLRERATSAAARPGNGGGCSRESPECQAVCSVRRKLKLSFAVRHGEQPTTWSAAYLLYGKRREEEDEERIEG